MTPAPLDLAALRGLLARRAAQWAHTDPDAFHEMDTKIATALPALLDFAAEAADLLGRAAFTDWSGDHAKRKALLERLAGNGEAR